MDYTFLSTLFCAVRFGCIRYVTIDNGNDIDNGYVFLAQSEIQHKKVNFWFTNLTSIFIEHDRFNKLVTQIGV